MRKNREFFRQDSYRLGISLLGKVICLEDEECNLKRYRIVEVEAYGGVTDQAAHSYNNNRTKRTEMMYRDGGHVYIYLIYGMYYMLNIVANVENNPEAVLIRAVEPLDDVSEKLTTNGPGKLCRDLKIDKSFNGLDLAISNKMYIFDDNYQINEIVYAKRINIDYAKEDANRLWRFYLKGNRYVSV